MYFIGIHKNVINQRMKGGDLLHTDNNIPICKIASGFLHTLGCPHAFTRHFARSDQLATGLSTVVQRPCWAHKRKTRCISASGFFSQLNPSWLKPAGNLESLHQTNAVFVFQLLQTSIASNLGICASIVVHNVAGVQSHRLAEAVGCT